MIKWHVLNAAKNKQLTKNIKAFASDMRRIGVDGVDALEAKIEGFTFKASMCEDSYRRAVNVSYRFCGIAVRVSSGWGHDTSERRFAFDRELNDRALQRQFLAILESFKAAVDTEG